jgi:hypothetical protein
MHEIIVEPLGDHPRGAFCCALKPIDNFFKNNALKAHDAYSQRVFIARRPDDLTPIGFYSLMAQTFKPGMSDEADEKFARFETIPTIYLPMIARDRKRGRKASAVFLCMTRSSAPY